MLKNFINFAGVSGAIVTLLILAMAGIAAMVGAIKF
jgi:hypothetical protein